MSRGEPWGQTAGAAVCPNPSTNARIAGRSMTRPRRTAVRRGRVLERPAMRALVEGLGHTVAPAVCPHGSPLLMHVGADVLERQFGWS